MRLFGTFTRGMLAVALVSLAALPCRAQDAPSASELFERGLAALKRGDYVAACPALAESYRREPLAGALFTLAECEARAGKVASSWLHFGEYLELYKKMDAARQSAQRERAGEARRQRKLLEPDVPYLTIAVKNADDDALLERSGEAVPRDQWNKALPVDPGVHRLRLHAPDGREKKALVQLGRAERLEVPLALPPPKPKPKPKPVPAGGSAPPVDGEAPTSGWTIGGWVAVGLSIAGIGATTGATIALLSRKSTVDDSCVGTLCDAEGLDATEDITALSVLGSVGFGVAVAGAAASFPLFLLGASDDAPQVGLRISALPNVAGTSAPASATVTVRW
jgi:hypothetical protein